MQNTIHSENLPLPPHIGMLGKTINFKGGGGGGLESTIIMHNIYPSDYSKEGLWRGHAIVFIMGESKRRDKETDKRERNRE